MEISLHNYLIFHCIIFIIHLITVTTMTYKDDRLFFIIMGSLPIFNIITSIICILFLLDSDLSSKF